MIAAHAEPFDRDIQLILSEDLSPKARSATLAAFARDVLIETDAANQGALGSTPRRRTYVDGVLDASLDAVRPDGVIVAEYELVSDVLTFIRDELYRQSPVLTGKYRASHVLFADGQEVTAGGEIPEAREFVFMSAEPYARKIERGESSEAPEGVYEVVAAKARARFGNVARIGFEYRTTIGGAIIGGRLGNRSEQRNPAIVVTVR